MGSDLNCGANVVRFTLVILNCIFAALGLTVFGIGIWAVVQNSDYSFITGSSIASGGALLIVAGVVTAAVSVVGILGALFKLRPLLFIYALVVFLIVVLEIAAGILVFLFQGDVLETVADRSIEAITGYRVGEDAQDRDNDINTAVDAIQAAFSCCGYFSADDWITNNPAAIAASGGSPPSCEPCIVGVDVDRNCTNYVFVNQTAGINFNFNVTGDGCQAGSSTLFNALIITVGAVGIVFGICEIIGIVFSLLLCCCIFSARKQEVV